MCFVISSYFMFWNAVKNSIFISISNYLLLLYREKLILYINLAELPY